MKRFLEKFVDGIGENILKITKVAMFAMAAFITGYLACVIATEQPWLWLAWILMVPFAVATVVTGIIAFKRDEPTATEGAAECKE